MENGRTISGIIDALIMGHKKENLGIWSMFGGLSIDELEFKGISNLNALVFYSLVPLKGRAQPLPPF